MGARRVAEGVRERAGDLADLAGRRVGILIEPGAAFVSTLFGVLAAGGCALVLSPLHPLRETRYFCEDARVCAILVSEEHAPLVGPLSGAFDVVRVEELLDPGAPPGAPVRPLPIVAPASPALQLYTSGTTGKPKGAVLSHDNLAIQQRLVGEAWGFGDRDVLLHALPLHHMHGLVIALLTAIGAGSSTRMTTFEAASIWEQMGEVTSFMGVPAMYHRLFAAYDAAPPETRARWALHARRLRLATSGSAALPVHLAGRWRELTGNIPLERFGMTEIGVGLTNPLDGERFPGCVGFPLPSVDARITSDAGSDVAPGEQGELWIRGPSVFSGYHERPEETARAFVADPEGGPPWFRTGDTVRRVTELPGAPYKILGRTSVDILKSGGYKLSALEIEEVLREHGAVAEVAVVGVPDEAWGERVVACVVLRPGAAPDGDALRAFARERLAPYKVPKEIAFLAELPKNALGKVTKPDLVRKFRSGTGPESC